MDDADGIDAERATTGSLRRRSSRTCTCQWSTKADASGNGREDEVESFVKRLKWPWFPQRRIQMFTLYHAARLQLASEAPRFMCTSLLCPVRIQLGRKRQSVCVCVCDP